MKRKHNILSAFLLFWFAPDLINLTSLEVNEFIIDGSIRICVMLLMYDMYASVNFSRVYLKSALFITYVITIYSSFDYIITSLLLDNPLLDLISLLMKCISVVALIIGITQLTLSYHYKGIKLTRKNINRGSRPRWRT